MKKPPGGGLLSACGAMAGVSNAQVLNSLALMRAKWAW